MEGGKAMRGSKYAHGWVFVVPLIVALTAGCTSAQHEVTAQAPSDAEPQRRFSDIEREDVDYPVDVYDPFESVNRRIYWFNAKFDRAIFLPVVNAYAEITPDPARESVSNFFSNIGDLVNFANQLAQLKPMGAFQTAFRFTVNSTIGVLGVFDPATYLGMPKHDEDFEQTLGYWDVGNGPYIVLPILGPSNMRDTVGFVTDAVAFSTVDPFDASSFQWEYPPVLALNIINQRHLQTFRYYETGSPFEYELIRLLYGLKRELDIQK